ncbi:MAG: S-layer homology domain-containing protein [Oscillospiraceae bacterium]|nr:S-layer homology domain-containing protein [Oscillospiraceae bacterium]
MRKIIAFLLSVLLLSACCIPALAAGEDARYADALKTLGLFQGTDKGYELEKTLTREQGVVMIIRLLGAEKEALACGKQHPFADFAAYPWFAPYAAYAYSEGITKGVSDTAFGYGTEMTEAMFLTMLLRVLGYRDAEDGSGDFVWSDPFALAKTCKIAEAPKTGAFTRETMTQHCWNTLAALFKTGEKTLSQKLIADRVFTEAQLREATTGISGEASGTSGGAGAVIVPGSSSSSGSGAGGNISGGNTGGNTTVPEASKPVKPNETPRIPMP